MPFLGLNLNITHKQVLVVIHLIIFRNFNLIILTLVIIIKIFATIVITIITNDSVIILRTIITKITSNDYIANTEVRISPPFDLIIIGNYYKIFDTLSFSIITSSYLYSS